MIFSFYGGVMKQIIVLTLCFLNAAMFAAAADLSTAPSADLVAIYKQLRTIQAGDAASCENVEFKRDAAKFTFLDGRITFAAPIAGKVVAAKFEGEGKFELTAPSPLDKNQLARFAKGDKLEDTFREAVFFFTDDTYAELSKLVKIKPAPASAQSPFISSQKQYQEHFNAWWDNVGKRYPNMRNMAARMLADLTEESSKGFFLADFKGKKSGDLVFHISWNRDAMLFPGQAKGDEVLLVHVNPGSYSEWWSGFHLSSEYAKSKHPDHRDLLAHSTSNTIDLQVADDNRISATAQMEYVVAEPTRVLSLNLNGILRISAVQDESGNKLNFIQEARDLDSDPWVILNKPANPGETYELKITYKEDSTNESRMIHEPGSGLFLVRADPSWFPSFGSFDDRTQFEIKARSPKRYQFVASGVQTATEKQKDGLMTSWKTEAPLRSVGFNYGDFVNAERAAQNLKVTAYAGKDIPNDLKGIQSAVSVGQLAGSQWSNRDTTSQTGIAMGGFSTAKMAKSTADLGLQALAFFDFYFGALPFKGISVSEKPVGGLTESWPSIILLPYTMLLDSTTRNSLHFEDSGTFRDIYAVSPAREMSKQWWGHLVGTKTYHDQWLTEGIATYAALAYLRQFDPKELSNFFDVRRTWLLSKTQLGYRPVDVGPVWLNPQLDEYRGEMNNLLVNYKGFYIIEMLRMLLYDPQQKNPDARFITMLKDFVATYAGKNASTEDFRRIVEKHAGVSAEWFFEEWVYGAYTPKYDFSYQLADAENGQTEVSITVTQSDVPETFQMQLPLYISVKGEQKYIGKVPVTGTKPFKNSFKLPLKPDKVMLDPNRSILAEIHQ
jgi:hypothetical protein